MNTLKKRKSGKKGFTLMEMLIVVAIIGILIAIAIPTFNNALTKARIAADEANLRSYYSEQITAYMLDGKTLEPVGEGAKTFKISGENYTLQAGTFKAEVTTNGDDTTLKITYTPTNTKYKAVTIPGATNGTIAPSASSTTGDQN